MTPTPGRPNRLIHETSPYLLQHAHNPVDWYPWGPEAFERARAEHKPVLLSVGYSACHWCHVMAHESFEDAETARLMNELFVNVKVDREELPDVDGLYMEAVQAMTGRGGWPMTVFLTPEGKPFYGGTYFPPEPRHGLPGFRQLLSAIADAWQERPQELEAHGRRLAEALAGSAPPQRSVPELAPGTLEGAADGLLQTFDPTEGGFGGAPKFPQPMALDFLLQTYRRTANMATLHAVTFTLDKMAHGGIHDQLGGGFHRYSTDARWLVPHFEKMLYDNALLARTYLHAWQVTGEPGTRAVVEGILDYVLREMTSPEGGFYSSQDADSEGQEGRYYVWAPAEVEGLLGSEDAGLFMAYFGVTPGGNFAGEGRNSSILHVAQESEASGRGQESQDGETPGTPTQGAVSSPQGTAAPERLESRLARGRQALLSARQRRVPPGRDDKTLAEWHGLMLHAMAEAGAVLARPDYLTAARLAGEFMLARLAWRAPDGTLRLYRSYKAGQAHLPGYLEDYAAAGLGTLGLYEATLEPRWLQMAAALASSIMDLFFDPASAGFFQSSGEGETLIERRKQYQDNALPSGNSLAAELFLRLGRLLGRDDYTRHAEGIIRAVAGAAGEYPGAFGKLLCALDLLLNPGYEIAILGDPAAPDTLALLAAIRARYLPASVLALRPPEDVETPSLVPFLAERVQIGGRATAYVCRDYVCQLPVTDPAALGAQLAHG